MKKLMIAASAALCATVGFSDVTSANVVGYQQYSPDASAASQYLSTCQSVGVCFYNMGNAEGSFSIVDTIGNVAIDDYDTIMIFNPDINYSNYDTYTYMGSALGWMVVPASFSEPYYVDSILVNKGDAIVYVPVDVSKTFSFAGEVERPGEVKIDFTLDGTTAFFPLVNPFPVATTIGDLDSFAHDYDTVLVFNRDMMYYNYDSWMKMGDLGWFWVSANFIDMEYKADANTIVLRPGEGGVFQPQQSTEWVKTLNF